MSYLWQGKNHEGEEVSVVFFDEEKHITGHDSVLVVTTQFEHIAIATWKSTRRCREYFYNFPEDFPNYLKTKQPDSLIYAANECTRIVLVGLAKEDNALVKGAMACVKHLNSLIKS